MTRLNLKQIKDATNSLLGITEEKKNNFLDNLIKVILKNENKIIKANENDIESAKRSNLSKAFLDRLLVDKKAIKNIVLKLKNIKKLSSGLGKVIEQNRLENGLLLKKVRTPIGVILVIYESRPEVTLEVVTLCIKSGNGVILKAGHESLFTNTILYKCILEALKISEIDQNVASLVISREIVGNLLKQDEWIDLVIARGGYDLVRTVVTHSSIPVLAHSSGGSRIYIDKSANLSIAKRVIMNAKTSKPSACNSLDTILIHSSIERSFIADLKNKLKAVGVKIISGEEVWDTEFLDLRVSIKLVRNVDEAIDFIGKYGKKHSEGIIAQDSEVINKFSTQVDAAAVFINCSTRLHDGYIFGMGSEIGISTGKLHARGPVGLKELTSYKWEVYGYGQIRE